ncbi:MAG: hypothetical protein ACFFHV_20015 [Promethearchaeota archaeon]
MSEKNWNVLSFKLLIIAIIQFIVLSTIAMIFYTGGTKLDPDASSYSFWANFFSDLGRTKSLSGKPNLISCVIYIISGTILAISITPFTISISHFFKEGELEKKLRILLVFFGFITSSFWIAAMITPWDLYGNTHLLFGIIYTTTGVIVLLLLAIMIFLNDSYPNKYAFILIYYFGIYFFNLIIVILLRYNPNTVSSLIVQATFQKITLYLFLGVFIYLGNGALKFNKLC